MRGNRPVATEVDSLEVIKMVQASDTNRSFYSLVKEIQHLISLRETCIIHVKRSENKDNNCLAKKN